MHQNGFAPLPSTTKPATLGEDAYYGIAGAVVRELEPHSEADPASLLVQLLVAAGNALGRETPAYRVESDYHRGGNPVQRAVNEPMPKRPVNKQPITSHDIVDGYLARRVWLDDRTRYNLACYYTRLSAKTKTPGLLDTALAHLRAATETRDLATWAERDPALKHLRDARKSDFEEAIGKKKPSTRPVIARLPGIGAANAERLASAKISSIGDLLDLASQKDDRVVLSTTTTIPALLLEQWALLGEVVTLPGVEIDLDQAALLKHAGLGSVATLRRQEPPKLVAILSSVKTTEDAQGDIPDEDEAKQWIEAAKRTKSRVEAA